MRFFLLIWIVIYRGNTYGYEKLKPTYLLINIKQVINKTESDREREQRGFQCGEKT